MIRWKRLLLGAVTFLAVHVVLVTTWRTWTTEPGATAPWFMNSTAAVGFTAAIFAIVNAIAELVARAPRPEEATVAAVNVGTGAVVPMVVVLFTLRTGPGNLFTIAIAIGALVCIASSAAGALVAWALSKAARTVFSR